MAAKTIVTDHRSGFLKASWLGWNQSQLIAGTLEFASEDLSTYFFKSLFKEECDKDNLFQMGTVATIQMSKCYVLKNLEEVLDFHQSLASSSDKGNTYQLPDGTPVELMPLERTALKMFVSPQVFCLQGPSISQALVDSTKSYEVPRQPMLIFHVVPCGGNSLYPGFIKCLCQELNLGVTSPARPPHEWVRKGT
ncbi:Actin-like protein 8 [Heterocephalus glaber]|uniref:Actin-like protein 8 n=1 Tax=Heterocephalus glaber TaxID=10181 RepID=G5BWB2_HETGA|nr:Actin-like protein 8 [Heterocephalus glaber]